VNDQKPIRESPGGPSGIPDMASADSPSPARSSEATDPDVAPQHADRGNGPGAGKWRRLPGSEWVIEKWFAWHESREMLALYHRVRSEEPLLAGRALYERILVRRSGLDATAVARVLRRATESLCDWPSGRDLRFRDLVQYVVTTEYLHAHVTRLGTQTDMGKTIARVIPDTL
jgi:hypothetical protein